MSNEYRGLISAEELCASRVRYLTKHPAEKTKAEILVEIVQQEPNVYTAGELSEASGMSVSWVRKILRANGLKAAKPRSSR